MRTEENSIMRTDTIVIWLSHKNGQRSLLFTHIKFTLSTELNKRIIMTWAVPTGASVYSKFKLCLSDGFCLVE